MGYESTSRSPGGPVDRAEELDIFDRILAHIQSGTTDRSPGVARFAMTDYADATRHAAEVENILRRCPVILAHDSQLPTAGSFLTMTFGRVPILLVRTPSGRVNGFVNVCRHRAACLVDAPRGGGMRAIVCPYHSWSYDLDGNLVTLPDGTDSFPELDRSELGLRTIPAEVRHGFIWTQLSGAAAAGLDLAGYLGSADADIGSYGFDRYLYYRGSTEHRMFNWKTCIEGFLENYHFSTLHKKSTNRIFVNNLAVFDALGIHMRAVAPKRTVTSLVPSERDSWQLREHATLLYVLFPNTCIFMEKQHISVLQVVPDGPASSLVHISHLVASDNLMLRDYWDANIDIFMSAVNEDLDICESMTRGMAGCSAGDEIVFGRNEGACARFRQTVDACLEDPDLGPQHINAEIVVS